jgi:hypothetical protein
VLRLKIVMMGIFFELKSWVDFIWKVNDGFKQTENSISGALMRKTNFGAI